MRNVARSFEESIVFARVGPVLTCGSHAADTIRDGSSTTNQ